MAAEFGTPIEMWQQACKEMGLGRVSKKNKNYPAVLERYNAMKTEQMAKEDPEKIADKKKLSVTWTNAMKLNRIPEGQFVTKGHPAYADVKQTFTALRQTEYDALVEAAKTNPAAADELKKVHQKQDEWKQAHPVSSVPLS